MVPEVGKKDIPSWAVAVVWLPKFMDNSGVVRAVDSEWIPVMLASCGLKIVRTDVYMVVPIAPESNNVWLVDFTAVTVALAAVKVW